MPLTESLLAKKMYGQPYLPTDLWALMAHPELYLKGLVYNAHLYILSSYFHQYQPWGYVALAKDLIFALMVWRLLLSVHHVIFVVGPSTAAAQLFLEAYKRGNAVL